MSALKVHVRCLSQPLGGAGPLFWSGATDRDLEQVPRRATGSRQV